MEGDASLIYYDVTNYYFETEKQDDTRKDGFSKEHRRDPIIQMGMAIDRNGLPMAYRTYPGNTHDSETYIPSLTQIKKEYNVGRAVIVADKGLNCGDNIVFSSALKDGRNNIQPKRDRRMHRPQGIRPQRKRVHSPY